MNSLLDYLEPLYPFPTKTRELHWAWVLFWWACLCTSPHNLFRTFVFAPSCVTHTPSFWACFVHPLWLQGLHTTFGFGVPCLALTPSIWQKVVHPLMLHRSHLLLFSSGFIFSGGKWSIWQWCTPSLSTLSRHLEVIPAMTLLIQHLSHPSIQTATASRVHNITALHSSNDVVP